MPNTTVIRSSLSSYIQLLEKIFKEPKIKITKDKLYVYDRAIYVYESASGRKHTITAYLDTKDVEILVFNGDEFVPVEEKDIYKEIITKTKELIGGIKH